MAKSEGLTVYPIFNGQNVQFIPGIPATIRTGLTKKEAEELIATGAFTYDKPPAGVDVPTEGPPDGGPLDSKE
jgi:hypothetical protein